jgi:hypothetical protein
MRIGRTRTFLWSIGAALAGAGLLAAAAGMLLPYETPSTEYVPGKVQEQIAKAKINQVPPMEQFQPLLAKNLRPPLTGETVVAEVVPTNPVSTEITPPIEVTQTFSAQLEGTAIEHGHSYALFSTGGELKWVTIGEIIGDAEVVEIRGDGVTLRRGEQTLTVNLNRPVASNGV